MKIQFKVFSAHVQPHAVLVRLQDDSETEAHVDRLVVQLIPTAGGAGTVKLILPPTEENVAEFPPQAVIDATFEKE